MSNPEWRRWLPFIVSAVLLVGTVAVGVVPGVRRHEKLRQRLVEKQQELDNLRGLATQQDTLKRKVEEGQARYGPPVGLNPATDLLPRALSEVEAVCRTSSVDLVNLQPGSSELHPDGWARVSLQVRVRGSLDGVARQMLMGLRQTSPVMTVDRLDLNRSSQSQDGFEGQVWLSAYAMLTPEAQKTLQAEQARRPRGRSAPRTGVKHAN